MRIFFVILAVIRGVLIILTMLVFILGYALSRIFLKHTKKSGLKLRMRWIKYAAYPILNLKVEVKGKPVEGAAVYVCNHRSFTDPIILSKFLNAFVIAKAEVASYPIINKGAEVTGIIYVQRDNKTSRTSARKAFVDVVQSGYNILVYPEGTIGTSKFPIPFKKGTFHESANEGLTVVPVAIEYRDKQDLWTIHNFIGQYIHQYSKWRTVVKLTFGPPLNMTDGDELVAKSYQWISGELENMQKDWIRVNWDEFSAS